MVDRPERLAELPADLVHFLRSRGLALAAERRDGGPQAAPVRGIVYAPHQLVGLEAVRSEEHTSEIQSQSNIVCRLLLGKKIESLQTLTVLICQEWPPKTRVLDME